MKLTSLTTIDFATKKKKNCRKSYPCGESCISKSKNCRKRLKGQAKTYAGWLQKQAGNLENVELSNSSLDNKKNLTQSNRTPGLRGLENIADIAQAMNRDMLDYEKGELKFHKDLLARSDKDLAKANRDKRKASDPESKRKVQKIIKDIKEERKEHRDRIKELESSIKGREAKETSKASRKSNTNKLKQKKETPSSSLERELEKEITKRLGDQFNRIAAEKRSPTTLKGIMQDLDDAILRSGSALAKNESAMIDIAKRKLKRTDSDLRRANKKVREAKADVKNAKNSRSKTSREKKLSEAEEKKQEVLDKRKKLRNEIKVRQEELTKRSKEVDSRTPKNKIAKFERATAEQIDMMRELRKRVRKESLEEKQLRNELEKEIKKRDIRKGDLISNLDDKEIADSLFERSLEVQATNFDPNKKTASKMSELEIIKDEVDDEAAEAISKINGAPRTYETLSVAKKKIYDNLVDKISAADTSINYFKKQLKSTTDEGDKKSIKDTIKLFEKEKTKHEKELDGKREKWNVE